MASCCAGELVRGCYDVSGCDGGGGLGLCVWWWRWWSWWQPLACSHRQHNMSTIVQWLGFVLLPATRVPKVGNACGPAFHQEVVFIVRGAGAANAQAFLAKCAHFDARRDCHNLHLVASHFLMIIKARALGNMGEWACLGVQTVWMASGWAIELVRGCLLCVCV